MRSIQIQVMDSSVKHYEPANGCYVRGSLQSSEVEQLLEQPKRVEGKPGNPLQVRGVEVHHLYLEAISPWISDRHCSRPPKL